jgi:hypothetical protein
MLNGNINLVQRQLASDATWHADLACMRAYLKACARVAMYVWPCHSSLARMRAKVTCWSYCIRKAVLSQPDRVAGTIAFSLVRGVHQRGCIMRYAVSDAGRTYPADQKPTKTCLHNSTHKAGCLRQQSCKL